MSDGVKGVVQEAVIKPVADEVGKDIEQGLGTVVYGPPQQDPGQLQQKQQAEKKRIIDVRWRLDRINRMQEEGKRVEQQSKQTALVREEVGEKERKVEQFEIKKKQLPQEVLARSQTERKSGRGVGG